MTPKDRAFALYQKLMLDNQSDMVRWMTLAIEEAIKAERERCAKIAEEHMKSYAGHRGCCGPADAAQGIANDIRKEPLVL